MLADKWPRQLPLTVLAGLDPLLLAGIPGPAEEAIVVIDVGSNRVVGNILTRPPAPPAPDGL